MSEAAQDLPSSGALSRRTSAAAAEVLAGRRRGIGAVLPFAGPAVIASVAYMDPGNFATNIQAGARYGYTLLWVVVLANLVAMLFQALSARLGIATGHNLAELCRDHFRRPVVLAMWLVAEAAAMATDLAEFLGAAIGLSLLLHLPLLLSMVGVGVATFALLSLQGRGFRPMELAIAALIGVIGFSYVAELLISPPDWGAVLFHSVVPGLADAGALTIAVGIIGATVMPHAIYLHSSLTQHRIPAGSAADRRALARFSDREVVAALSVAGLINMAMVAMAASAFHAGHPDVAEIGTAYDTLVPLLGAGAAGVFLLSLLASGLSSSVVGTIAGQVVMQGFVGFRIPVLVRRLVTMAPAFVVVALGVNPTEALVLSQVALSVVLPVPMVALLLLVRRPDVMGPLVVGTRWLAVAGVSAALVLGLNLLLVAQATGVPIPFLADAG